MKGKIVFIFLTSLWMFQAGSSCFAEEIICEKQNGKTKCWNVKNRQDEAEESIKLQQEAEQTADDIMRRHPELASSPQLIEQMLELRAHYMQHGSTMSQALVLAERALIKSGHLREERVSHSDSYDTVKALPPSTSQATALPVTANNSGRVIESQVDGSFDGWDGETIVRLTNGQVWQQNQYHYEYHYGYMPKVVIYNNSGQWKMHVEGTNKPIPVERLK